MPSAANVKTDKHSSPDGSGAPENSGSLTPLRQAITIIEHKIRNLEKRKSKLESYRDLQNAGKELNSDQKIAVAKYDEVVQTLEFARDLCKQFLGIASNSEKEAKKQAKKEAQQKSQAELARLREILLVQDALNQMGNEAVRDDFLHGRNGAAQLNESDLQLLDDIYPAVTPKHESGNPTAFTNEVQAAAEHLLAVVDGKPKEVFGGTYSQVKEILGKIHESGYFDQAPDYVEPAVIEGDEGVYVQEEQEQFIETEQQHNLQETVPDNLMPIPSQPPHEPLNMDQPIPPEQMFYQQQPPNQPPIPLQRPIAEMLNTGTFFFLQDSEIDNTPLEQIPSQTYTNQNYVNPPPPPIPLPTQYHPLGNNLPPQLQQQQPTAISNNGLEDPNMNSPQADSLKQLPNMTGNRPPRNNYYQQQNSNNGNYNNRPRQNRNNGMPRQGNNRNN
ncbi:caprin homolog [Coccinella septempunctata]|uniref:caprin homolog n=1 Tax=Coccinella septempunctata TaxID=41139 RepID=UPI001D08EA33|nr:caprin homolog [Coccinella septempunctata]